MNRLLGYLMRPALLAGLLPIGLILQGSGRGLAQSHSAPAFDQPSSVSPEARSVSQAHSSAAVDQRLVAAQNQFGFRLFAQVLSENTGKNVLISPSSVAIALSMLYNGASGSTQQAMAQTLNLQGLNLSQLNQANAALMAALESADPNIQLAVANSLWGRQGIEFKPSFLQSNQTFYRAEITTLNFSSPDAIDRINAWVSQHTAGKIPEIIDRIDPQQVLFLINAIYFKGNWSRQFDASATHDRPFHLLDGSTRQQPAMTQRGSYRYLETPQFQAVNLPYGSGRLSMYVFLPKPNSNLRALQQLTAANWDTWMQRFSNKEGTIQLPRFKLEFSSMLNDALAALGMAAIFDPAKADFSGISTIATHVDRVQHKTYIEVNETGTEAAAVTSIGVRMTAMMPPSPPFAMVVDRPFLYAIRDNQTGAVLFMGTVVNPE